MENSKGCFIAFEGIDGSGKSTQIKKLGERLRALGKNVYCTKEQTDSPIGSLIHSVMTGRIVTDNRVIAALFVADRLDHLLNPIDGILERINSGETVITDRYYFSSYAYHSVDMPMKWVIDSNSQSAELLKPTCNIFIDIPASVAIERIEKNRSHKELFETFERLEAVRKNYYTAFDTCKDEKVIIINGTKSEEEIASDVWNAVKSYFQ